MMYDELIKRLRASCESCKLWDGYKCCLKGECTAQTRLQAADVIEELSKKYLASEVDNTNLTGWLAEEHAKHLWIPVTERLPEEYTRVIGFMAWKAMTAIEFQNGKWYSIDHLEPLPDEAVTYWMPLPEPPKGEV